MNHFVKFINVLLTFILSFHQDVLQNNNGRRKRSLTSGNEFTGNSTIEENGRYFTHYFGEEPEAPKNDRDNLQRTGEKQDGKLQDNSQARSFSFLEDFFIRLPQTLGLKRMVCDNPVCMGNIFLFISLLH